MYDIYCEAAAQFVQRYPDREQGCTMFIEGAEFGAARAREQIEQHLESIGIPKGVLLVTKFDPTPEIIEYAKTLQGEVSNG